MEGFGGYGGGLYFGSLQQRSSHLFQNEKKKKKKETLALQ